MLDLPPPNPTMEVVLASRGMSKGIAQTENGQVVVKPSVTIGPIQVGAQWKNVDSAAADGEAAAYANLVKTVGRLQLNGGVAYKWQTSVNEPADSRSWEFTGGATAKFGKLSLRASAIYSPNDLGGARQSTFLEAGPAYDLGSGWRLSGAIARRHRVDGPDYTAFNGGIGYTVHKVLTLDLRYYDTAQSGLGEPYHARVVGSLRITL